MKCPVYQCFQLHRAVSNDLSLITENPLYPDPDEAASTVLYNWLCCTYHIIVDATDATLE